MMNIHQSGSRTNSARSAAKPFRSPKRTATLERKNSNHNNAMIKAIAEVQKYRLALERVWFRRESNIYGSKVSKKI